MSTKILGLHGTKGMYHLTGQLEIAKCSTVGDFCPYGDLSYHYETYADADTAKVTAKATRTELKRTADWATSLPFYSLSSPGYDGAVARQFADCYFENREAHREHLSKFSGELKKGCLYCGSKKDLSLSEHIFAVTRGGITVVGNLIVVCRCCNGEKGNLSHEAYFQKKLMNPNFNHPVFGRSMERFLAFVYDYTRPFRENYPEEWARAVAIEEGDSSALNEFFEKAYWYRVETIHPNASHEFKKEIVEAMIKYRETSVAEATTSEARRESDNHLFWVTVREESKNQQPLTKTGFYSAAERIFSDYERYGLEETVERWHNYSARVPGGNGLYLRRSLKILRKTA